jgi:ABC-type transporter Mla subunit MlaD
VSDPLAERLKQLAEQHAKGKQAEQDVQAFQEHVNKYIADNARGEYEKLLRLLKERVDKVNLALGSLPQFVVGQQQVQQGNMAAYLTFEKPIMNMPNNALVVSFGAGPNSAIMLGIFGPPPQPVRFRMQAAAADDFSRIVWTGDLGEIASEQLVDFVLEQLTTYYLEHHG